MTDEKLLPRIALAQRACFLAPEIALLAVGSALGLAACGAVAWPRG